MLVLVDITPELFEQLKSTIVKKGYGSMQDFADVALRNQLLFEELGPEALTSLGKQEGQSASHASLIPKPTPVSQTSSVHYVSTLQQPPDGVQVVEAPPVTSELARIPLWGQMNRLAPLKLVLRMLANFLALETRSWMDYKKFASTVAESAPILRELTEKIDRIERVRGEELFVGLPRKDPKSQQRFVSQYIGRLRKDNRVEGLGGDLGFVNIREASDGSTVIGITETGLTFAALRNPLIDDLLTRRANIDQPLSNEEITFLIGHIKSVRPGEYDFLLSVLGAIKTGANQPIPLQAKIKRYFEGKEFGYPPTHAVFTTLQAGATSKLTELRLVRIEKNGQRSIYNLTPQAETLMSKV